MREQLGTTPEVAEYLQKDERTLANWRSLEIGPPFIKLLNGSIRYDWDDVRAWLASQRRIPAASGQDR